MTCSSQIASATQTHHKRIHCSNHRKQSTNCRSKISTRCSFSVVTCNCKYKVHKLTTKSQIAEERKLRHQHTLGVGVEDRLCILCRSISDTRRSFHGTEWYLGTNRQQINAGNGSALACWRGVSQQTRHVQAFARAPVSTAGVVGM